MGCATSKQFDSGAGAGDVYRPAAASFAVFDINAVKEPWIAAEEDEKPTSPEKTAAGGHLPSPIFDKLDTGDGGAPRSWDEVSKELEDLKPTLNSPKPPKLPPAANGAVTPPETPAPAKKVKRKSFSFHTLEELENNATKKAGNKPPPSGLKKSESSNDLNKSGSRLSRVDPDTKHGSEKPESFNEFNKFGSRLRRTDPGTKSGSGTGSVISTDGVIPLKENPFLLRDRLEREREGKPPPFFKRDPLEDYPEICPPGGEGKVVIYTTSLGGIRRTYEDCNRVRSIMELHGFVYEERDISLHGEFRTQLKELLGELVSVPRMFVKGRYLGGVDEIVGLNEMSRLRRILSRVGIEKVVGRQACEGCGGARFVPCLDCGGSCKVVVGDKKEKERCPECNENGLVYCPICS